MRKINDFFSKTINRPLYHYTGINSLMGIANSKHIWASHAYYMNDSEEIVHACTVLENVLRPRFAFGNPDELENIFLKQFQEWTNNCRTTHYNIFVFSLSEQQSLLSQWRSYTPHGKGISIEFTEKTLNDMIKLGNLRIAKCLYEEAEQAEAISSLVDKLITTFKQENTDTTPPANRINCYYSFLDRFRSDILQVLSIIKNKAFEEEQEWRLISNHYPEETDSNIKYRAGASMLIPYIEMPFGDTTPYFGTVMLGPSPHKELSTSALSNFLKSKNLCNWVKSCEIPYREW